MASVPLNVNLAIDDVWMLDYAFLLKCSSNVLAIVCKIRRFRFFKLKKTKITLSTKPRQQSVPIVHKQKLIFVFMYKTCVTVCAIILVSAGLLRSFQDSFCCECASDQGREDVWWCPGAKTWLHAPSTAKLPAQTFATCKSTYATKM